MNEVAISSRLIIGWLAHPDSETRAVRARIAGTGPRGRPHVHALQRNRSAATGLPPGVWSTCGGDRRAPRCLARRAVSLREGRGDQARHDQAPRRIAEDLAD